MEKMGPKPLVNLETNISPGRKAIVVSLDQAYAQYEREPSVFHMALTTKLGCSIIDCDIRIRMSGVYLCIHSNKGVFSLLCSLVYSSQRQFSQVHWTLASVT